MVGLSWPALGTLGSAVANLALLWYLLGYRDEPGARWFVGVIACQVLMCAAYGVALLVADPFWLRMALEVPVWIAINWIGVFYLGFALEYTGRVDLLWSPWFGGFVAFEAVSTLLVATNSLHGWVWSDAALDPVFGAATVRYTHHAPVFLQFAALFVMTALGAMMLLDTVISYGPLYRRQAVAIAFTVVPPAAAFTVWTFELGPVPQLNLTPMMFLPHVVLDIYALFRRDMFEFAPTTRRTAERAAIDDLGTPVVILDRERRVVNLNRAALDLFGVDRAAAIAADLGSLYDGDDVDPADPEQDVTLSTDGPRRQFKVTSTPLRDAADTQVGYTVAFQDVTAERQRKQRLEVLNRVLRHNLRNDMVVVMGHAGALADDLDDERAEHAETIRRTADELTDLGEKARLAAEAVDEDIESRPVDLAAVLETVASGLQQQYDGTVEADVPEGLTLTTSPKFLELLFENLVENGLEHHEGPDPRVEVWLADHDADGVEVVVRDHGPGIPDHEVAVLETGEESALEHGSGLGLWLVNWSATIVGGEVSFEAADGGGTAARVRLPGPVGTAGD